MYKSCPAAEMMIARRSGTTRACLACIRQCSLRSTQWPYYTHPWLLHYNINLSIHPKLVSCALLHSNVNSILISTCSAPPSALVQTKQHAVPKCGTAAQLKHTQQHSLSLHGFYLLQRLLIMAGGKQHVHVPGPDADVAEHIWCIWGEQSHDALWDLLLTWAKCVCVGKFN